jgi:folate-binding protein YgfZ
MESRLEAECAAVRGGAGWIDLRRRERIEVRGADRISFLHRLLACDVAGLPEGASAYGALLTPKGKLLADVRLHRRPETVLLDLATGLGERVREHLVRHAVFDDVALVDVSREIAHVGLHGPRARAVFERADLPADLAAAPSRFAGEVGYDLFVDAASFDATASALADAGAHRIGDEAFEILRVEAGTPVWGPDLDETMLVDEAIPEAASVDKGCYVGQEIVARLRSRGHVNRELVGLRLEGEMAPPAGYPLRSGDAVAGRTASLIRSPARGAVLGMGLVHRRFLEEPTLEVEWPDGATTVARLGPRSHLGAADRHS